jgi:hypothetical protein
MFLKKLYLIFKFLIRKLDLFVGGSYLHKIYDYFYNPNMFILDKKHQRKIVLFYNQNNDLLSKLSSTYNTDKGSIEKIKTNKKVLMKLIPIQIFIRYYSVLLEKI